MNTGGRLAITIHLAGTGTGENKLAVFDAARTLPGFPSGGTIRQQSEFAYRHAQQAGMNPITLDKAIAFIQSITEAESPRKPAPSKKTAPTA